jgi:hypothetical protein
MVADGPERIGMCVTGPGRIGGDHGEGLFVDQRLNTLTRPVKNWASTDRMPAGTGPIGWPLASGRGLKATKSIRDGTFPALGR